MTPGKRDRLDEVVLEVLRRTGGATVRGSIRDDILGRWLVEHDGLITARQVGDSLRRLQGRGLAACHDGKTVRVGFNAYVKP